MALGRRMQLQNPAFYRRPRLGGTPRPTNSSALAAKMAALHAAPTGRLLFQSVRLTGKADFQAVAKVGA